MAECWHHEDFTIVGMHPVLAPIRVLQQHMTLQKGIGRRPFLFVVRNPYARAVSLWAHLKAKKVTAAGFTDWLQSNFMLLTSTQAEVATKYEVDHVLYYETLREDFRRLGFGDVPFSGMSIPGERNWQTRYDKDAWHLVSQVEDFEVFGYELYQLRKIKPGRLYPVHANPSRRRLSFGDSQKRDVASDDASTPAQRSVPDLASILEWVSTDEREPDEGPSEDSGAVAQDPGSGRYGGQRDFDVECEEEPGSSEPED